MIWTDQMQLTPERLNDLQKRADGQAFVIFDINKGFWGSQVQEAINNGQLIFIKYKHYYGFEFKELIGILSEFSIRDSVDGDYYRLNTQFGTPYIQSVDNENGTWTVELS